VGEITRECSDHATVANDVVGSERGGRGRGLHDVALAMVILDHRSKDRFVIWVHYILSEILYSLHFTKSRRQLLFI
jgi:hypothetical protein